MDGRHVESSPRMRERLTPSTSSTTPICWQNVSAKCSVDRNGTPFAASATHSGGELIVVTDRYVVHVAPAQAESALIN